LGTDFKATIVDYPTEKLLGYVDLTKLILTSLPQTETFVLVAESFSGPVAIMLAVEKPPALVGLILCASFARNPRPLLTRLASRFTLVFANWRPKGLLRSLFLNGETSKNVRDSFDKALNRVSPAVLAGRLREIVNVDVTANLARLDVQCLYIRATRDRVVPKAALKPFERFPQRWRARDLDGPHLILQVVPENAAEEIKEFVASLIVPAS
jgi:pimeloyl-ACP methyl ester carboxylesterase